MSRPDDDHLAEPPLDTGVTLERPSASAGGFGAIVSTMKHALSHMGPVASARTLLRVNQMDGFDCPGCAWPEPDRERSVAEFCENGAKAIASEATSRRATRELFADKSVADLAKESDFWLNEQGRLTEPMVLREGKSHYEPISWDDAFALIAEELTSLSSPDEAAFYTSGRTSNEAAFLYQLFVRQLGTNNLPDCSNMCHESSGEGLRESIGVGKGTVTLDDFELADLIFVVGQNPGTNHPRMLTALEAAVKRGATIVSVNPLREIGTERFVHPQDVIGLLGHGTELASVFLQVRINGDVALFQGLSKALLEEEDRAPGTVLDHGFLEAHCDGFEAWRAHIEATSWEEIVDGSGVSKRDIERTAQIAAKAGRTIACWAMGLTQHRNAVANIQEVTSFLLLRGMMGKPGAGVCPVRGHSNVQGDRTMGIWERMDEGFLDRLGDEFSFTPPRHHGLDVVDTIKAMRRGAVKLLFCLGGNFLSATPDTERVARALRTCSLTAYVSTKLHRGHLVTGKRALILPCLGRTERDVQSGGEQSVTVENSMSVVSLSRGTLTPASSELRSEVAIVAGLAETVLGARSNVPWQALAGDYDSIREHIANVVPGFEDFNARVRHRGGFRLPNTAREREWRTSTGRARFLVHEIPRHDLSGGRFLMMTIRSHDQYNTTVYGPHDRYRGIRDGRRVVLMNGEDAKDRGFAPGDLVDLTSEDAEGERIAPRFRVVPYSIPRACVATYFPETNVLVPLSTVAAKSNTPASKSVIVRITRSPAALEE